MYLVDYCLENSGLDLGPLRSSPNTRMVKLFGTRFMIHLCRIVYPPTVGDEFFAVVKGLALRADKSEKKNNFFFTFDLRAPEELDNKPGI